MLWTLKLALVIIKDCVKHSMCNNIHVCQCNVIQIEKILTYFLLQCRLPINAINKNFNILHMYWYNIKELRYNSAISFAYRNVSLLTECSEQSTVMRDQRVWSMKECAQVFSDCLAGLKKEFANQGENGMLVWDKVRLCP